MILRTKVPQRQLQPLLTSPKSLNKRSRRFGNTLAPPERGKRDVMEELHGLFNYTSGRWL
jgi:hypothetical protein